MRITSSTIGRHFLNNYNSSLNNLNKIQERITSQRKFNRASEDPMAAVRAMRVRKTLADLDVYEVNLNNAKEQLSVAESCLMDVSSIAQSVQEYVVKGTTGTLSESDREIIAKNVRSYADQMVKVLNTNYAGRSVFGGGLNSAAPFAIEQDGTLTFHGKDVTDQDEMDKLGTAMRGTYVDIGLGLTIGADGKIDPQTALKTSISGVEAIGTGSGNIVSVALDLANAIKEGQLDDARALLDTFSSAHSKVLLSISEVGNDTAYIDTSLTRITNDRYNALASQTEIEGADIAEESISRSMAQLAYNASLQMASQIIPLSLFDFLR